MKYRLRVLKKAREDMRKSAAWYDKREPGLGDSFLQQVLVSFRRIEDGPLHYEERFAKKFRFAVVEIFPFVVVFKIKGDEIIINSVFHTSRDPQGFH